MATGGIFVTLYDEETLNLYLEQGVYGQHMTPEEGEPSPYSAHYRTLADYGAIRDGYHVFFFLDRQIYYGGQVVGSDEYGAFYINGRKSPLGREADAPLVWDESSREVYEETDEPGVFETDEDDDGTCQPFLIRFEDEMGMAGNYVISDQLYRELGEHPYPLPSNSIAGMGFCTLTPGETDTLVNLLRNEPEGSVEPSSDEDVTLENEPVPYSPEFGVDSVEDAHPESHLEASIISNPSLLPSEMQPGDSVVCRQVPISPFKPANIDQADVCYFEKDDQIREGTIPNTIIELKVGKAGKSAALQVKRYLDWLHERLGDEVNEIEVFVYAPDYTRTFWDYIPEKYEWQIETVKFGEYEQKTL